MILKITALNPTQRRRLWLRWVLLCAAFSALHGLLGAWVVPAVAQGPVAEICTPNGLQWVALDEALNGEHPTDWPQGLAKPCLWASAHAAVPPRFWPGWGGMGLQLATIGGGALPGTRQTHLPGNAERVLLTAPMRAPPV